jgi:hypothetical protein
MQIAVIYHYFNANQDHLRNLAYFLDRGITPTMEVYVFYASPVGDLKIRYPEVAFIPVENHDYDFAGYSAGARLITPKPKFQYVFFLNSGVLGPIIPEYLGNWTDRFINLLIDDVKLAGTTIASPIQGEVNIDYLQSICPRSNVTVAHHVQTMFFAMKFETLVELAQDGLFTGEFKNDKQSLVHNFELLLSWKLLSKGFNISAILKEFQGNDYRMLEESKNDHSIAGDPYVINGYFGKSINPYDVIFYKTSRNLLDNSEISRILGISKPEKRKLPKFQVKPFLARIYINLISKFQRGLRLL